MLAEAEDIETDLVGKLDLLQEITDALDRVEPDARRRVRHVIAERIDAKFHPHTSPAGARARDDTP